MSHITLIRHGQANSTARDEDSYDKLSPLGHRQSGWLGAYLRDTGQHHSRLYTGTLTRHIETAEAMQTGLTPLRDPRLNELEYFTLATAMQAEHGLAIPTAREGFALHLPQVFDAWQNDRIKAAPEPFSAFEARVSAALTDISRGDGPALVVTSGGLIAMVLRQCMGLGIPQMANMALAIYNTSMHRLYPIGGQMSPVLFNAIPHLEHPERRNAQTHL